MSLAKPLILLVEDEPGFRRVYRDSLEHAGFRVVEASNGEEGWEVAQSQQPDLILLDIVMPKLNGFDLLERLRATAEHAATPIIIMSVLGEPGDMDTGMSLGADDYVVKGSVSTTDLVAKVRERLSAATPVKKKR